MLDEESGNWPLVVLPLLIVTLDLGVGILAYSFVSETLGALRPQDGLPALLPFGLAGALVGGILGVGQWTILRRKVPWADRWLLIAAVGLAVGMSVGVAVLRALAGTGAGEAWVI